MLAPLAPVGDGRDALLARALAERPELRAAEARVRARESAVDLARREYLPDLRVMGAYDSFWQESELQPMVGVELNLPLQRARRQAALDEAQASLEEARSVRAGLGDEVRSRSSARSSASPRRTTRSRSYGTGSSRPRGIASTRRARASRRGQSDFSALIDAERACATPSSTTRKALVEVSRRSAELARAVGALPGGTP